MDLLLAGLGRWGKIFYQNLLALDQAPSPVRLGLVTSRPHDLPPDFAGQSFPDLEAALAAQSWAGVILATPPDVHSRQAELCLRQQVPVLVEKPLAQDLAAAEALAATANSTGGKILVDHIHLFHPAYPALKARLAGQTIREIQSSGCNWGPFRAGYSPLWDYGAHDLSVVLDLLGSPRAIYCRGTAVGITEGGQSGMYDAELEFKGGAMARFRVGNLSPEKKRFYVVRTDDETITLEDFPRPRLFVKDREGVETDIAFPASSPLKNVLGVFVAGISGEMDPRWGLNLGVEVVRALTNCERSSVEQKKLMNQGSGVWN